MGGENPLAFQREKEKEKRKIARTEKIWKREWNRCGFRQSLKSIEKNKHTYLPEGSPAPPSLFLYSLLRYKTGIFLSRKIWGINTFFLLSKILVNVVGAKSKIPNFSFHYKFSIFSSIKDVNRSCSCWQK
jgi:hypothetical protein